MMGLNLDPTDVAVEADAAMVDFEGSETAAMAAWVMLNPGHAVFVKQACLASTTKLQYNVQLAINIHAGVHTVSVTGDTLAGTFWNAVGRARLMGLWVVPPQVVPR